MYEYENVKEKDVVLVLDTSALDKNVGQLLTFPASNCGKLSFDILIFGIFTFRRFSSESSAK